MLLGKSAAGGMKSCWMANYCNMCQEFKYSGYILIEKKRHGNGCFYKTMETNMREMLVNRLIADSFIKKSLFY